MMRAALALCLAACGALAGCAGRTAARASEPAQNGVSAYLSALRSDDPHRAYSLLSRDVRKDLPYDTFAALWKENAAERAHQARALEEDMRGGADLGERARVTLEDGKTLSLNRQTGGWRLEVPLLSRTHAATPHVAVEVFAAALGARDYEAVMRILTSRRRDGIGQRVDGFVRSLERHLSDIKHKVSFIGKDRAELQWTEAGREYKIILRLEGEEWRVDDVHDRPAPMEEEEPKPEEAKPEEKPAEPAKP